MQRLSTTWHAIMAKIASSSSLKRTLEECSNSTSPVCIRHRAECSGRLQKLSLHAVVSRLVWTYCIPLIFHVLAFLSASSTCSIHDFSV